MEEPPPVVSSGEDPIQMPPVEVTVSPNETTKKVAKRPTKPIISPASTLLASKGSARKRVESRGSPDSSTNAGKQSTVGNTSSSRTSISAPAIRRNSTGGVSAEKHGQNGASVVGAGKKNSAVVDPVRKSLPELRRSSLPSVATKPTRGSTVSGIRKSVPMSPSEKSLRTSIASDTSISGAARKPSVKPTLSASSSSSSVKRVSSTSLESSASSVSRKTISKVSSSSARSPSVSSGLRNGSLSTSLDTSSSLSARRRAGTPESRDSRFIALPQIELKGGDDVRLDLRGHRVRTLNANGLNLSATLEFVYLRDNQLCSLEGIEILKRVKVLDLSFNEFKGPGFEPLENCTALQQLYLAGNQITSLMSLPQLPNLEFLSVAQNKLKSLAMSSQPRLQVLAASKNKISTLKGFPYLPALEHLRVEENPILKVPYLEAASILLVGPTLKKFNDRGFTREAITIAKRYPACTALCIRDGWEFRRPENVSESIFHFLLEKWKDHLPAGYLLKDARVDQPFEDDICRCHFNFHQDEIPSDEPPLVLKYQWFVGERPLSEFIPIADANKEVLILKCYAGNGIPKVVNLEVHGELVEGSVIKGQATVAWCGGTPGKGVSSWLRKKWNSSPAVIAGAEDEEYQLTLEDVDSSLVFMYTPVTEEGAKGEPQYKYTDFVKAAPPKVSNVKIIGDLRENSKITVTGIVTGGTEGSSRVQWFKTTSSTFDDENALEALSTSKIAKAFRIPLGAVGYYIVAKYTPMTSDGESGQPAYAMSEAIIETLPPSLNFLSITGDYTEGAILTASYGYVGGHEGKSIYNWYLHEVETDSGILIPEGCGVLQYRVNKDAIGKFVSFECVPVRDDDIVGEPRSCMGQERLQPGSPRLLALQIVGSAVEGTQLSINKKYWGGEEGESVFRWFRIASDGTQFEIPGANASSYTMVFDDIGSYVSVSCEPVRSDWSRGPVVLSEQVGPIVPGPPTCQSLEFLGSMIEGQRVSFIATYTGGDRGNCSHDWFRVRSNGVREKLSDNDFLDLTLEDVGKNIELIYFPIRKDGARGSPKTIKSKIIVPADPVGLELKIPDCCEEVEVIPHKRYFGGPEGPGEYVWYRTNDKLHGQALMDISHASEDVAICGKTLAYTPSLEDVGSFLALCWVPVRADGKRGKPLVAISSSPVNPGLPSVSEVHAKELSSGAYCGEGIYFGGYEGSSRFSWYRETNEGKMILIDGANSVTYEVTDSDYTCRLLFGYTPVRSDSVVGELVLSARTDIILPELPRVEMLALTGKAIEGDILTAVEVIPESLTQQCVWSKYKKNVKYQWFRSSESGDSNCFEPLTTQVSCSYKMRLEDIGRCLRCECIVYDVFGRSSEPAYAVTAAVLPGIPRMHKLEIEGRGYHTNLYAVRGVYSGGKEGKSRIQWLRSMVGSPDLISIQGEVGRMYEANVDDVGYRLVAIYTPIREDGIEGQPVSASTEPISVEPDVLAEVKQKLNDGSVKFEVLCDKDRSSKKFAGEGSLERRVLEINRKRVKVVKPGSKTSFPATEIRGSYTPPFHVELFRNDQHRLRIVVDSENVADVMVHSRHLRDIVVLVIRGLAQRFNSTSLNSLLKIDT
ncbi:187-kDa microtubule-associated protein AIR9 [Linum grandiflorum]